MRNLLASLFFLSLTLIPSHSHPLCLDAEPPFSFSSSDNALDFCKEYSTFGCCTREDDRRIQAVHDDYIKTAPSTNCSSYLRTLLCLECSPYAAHVFDAEGATTTTSRKYFPGLCTGYCNDLYRTCKEIIPVVTSDSRIRNAVAAGQQAFCNEARISDMIYCYPDIINNTDLNQVIIRQQSGEQGCLCLETFATQLRNALLLVYPNDGTGRIFVGEQLGLVSIYYKNGTKLPELFMDISYLVLTSSSPGDERGFLGMVFHPNFTTNQHFYVYFTIGTNGAFRTRISEFTTMSSNPNKVDVHSERVLLEIDQPFSNHNGGEMLFGFDGYLYVTVGDGGAGGDPYNNGQNLSALLGKILRIDVNGRTNNRQYDIPPNNPFIATPNARPEIFAYGLRNTWRCSFDKGDFVTGAGRGRLFCGDVGQSRYEEIDIIKSGLNYGWRAREGFECYDSNMCGRIGPEELPIFAYGRDLGQSVTGGYVYRGCHYPSLNGLYIYGDYSSGRIFRLKDIGQPVWENKEILMCQSQYCTNGLKNTYERNILSFGEDFDGDVYVLTTSNPSPTSFSGSIYRLVDPLRRNDPTLCTAGSSLTSQSSSGPTSSTSVTPSSTSKPTSTSTSPSPTSTSPQKPTDNSTQSASRVTNPKTTPVSSAPSTTTPAPSTATTTTTTFSSSSTKIQTTASQTQRSSSSVTRNTSPQLTPTRSSTSASSTTEGIVGNDSPVIWSCDFEDPSGKPTWCNMQQATDDNFDWTILSGPTPSDPTGPDQAYKGQYYIYIEASNPRKSNDTAKIYIPVPINSPVAAGQFCLSFAYHMFGFHIREIRLITENSADGASNNMIWHQVKEKENFWLTAKVTINLQSGAKVAFVGIRGDEYSGDIALDDIKLQNGRC